MNIHLSLFTYTFRRTALLRGVSVLSFLAVSAVQLQAVSVKDFGAAGDGSTDDADAFREAMEEAASKSEDLEIPAGRYFIGSDITVDEPIQFVGAGHEASVITARGETSRFFLEASGSSFEDLGFENMIEPIALVSRADYTLENLRFERVRFEDISIENPNRGVIGLSSSSKSQRPYRINNLVIRDSIFRDIHAHAVNIRGNISRVQLINNQFLDIINEYEEGANVSNWALGGYAIRLGESSDDAGMKEEFADQGHHIIEGNVIRNLKKTTVVGNLKAMLLYGNYTTIRNNLFEDIDGDADGDDVNAMYIRGAFNEISGNTIRNIRGSDDDGAVSFKGGLDLGSQGNKLFHNYIENIYGMAAVEVSSDNVEFYENEIVNAARAGFYQRKGSSAIIRDNIFRDADTDLRTVGGEVIVAGNWYIDSRIWLSHRDELPANRDGVYIAENLFQRTSGSDSRFVRFANMVEENFVSVSANRFEYLNDAGDGDVIDLVANGSLEEVEIIDNHVEQKGDANFSFHINSSSETVSGNTFSNKGSFTDTDSNGDGPGIPEAPVDPVAPEAPAGLEASGFSTERIDLIWSAPYNGGSELIGYRIQRKIAGEASFSDLIANTGDTNSSYSDFSVTPETTYVYRVTAINSIGESDFSNEATATATEPVEPVLDLKAFGAVGDGTTDDTQALRDAIAYFGSEGLALAIPAGRYLITEDIAIDQPVQFVGSGNGEAVITSNGGTARLYLRASGTAFTDVGFEDMVAPIVLESRSGYILENVTFERCRFENMEVHDKNQGVIGLTSGSSSERPYPIRNLVVKDSIFKTIDANVINVRANISNSQVINNQFLDIVNLPEGASPADTFVIRLGDPETTHAAGQGNHLVEGNVLRNISKSTVDGNLIGILLYGDYSVVRDNLIEGVDGTDTGLDTNAIYVRGSFNEVVANTIRDVRGTANNGAIHIRGEMALGNTGNIISGNVLENIEGMFAVEAYTSDLVFSGNEITAAPVGGFVHRDGSNVTISENSFNSANVLLQTTAGDAAVAGNDFIESRITLSQHATTPAARDSVSIAGNLFRRTRVDTPLPMIGLADAVAEEFVSIRNNRFENLAESSDGESAVNLVANGTLQRVEILDNDVVEAGAEGSSVFVIDSPEETVSGNEITYEGGAAPTLPVDEAPAVELTMDEDGTGFTLIWSTETGYLYQVQFSSDLENWTDSGEPIVGDGTKINVSDLPEAEGEATFYRLSILPASL